MLTPEEIRSRSFLVSLRGYDREEVAAFLNEVAAQVEELEQGRVPAGDGEVRQQPADTDPSALFAQIGQETQRILEAAQQAGDELRHKAEEETAALRERTDHETAELRERTERDAAELRERTEQETASLRREAEEETAALRQRTTREVELLRREAEEETQALRERTREEADREIKAARSQATKLIADGERRREAMERVLAQMTEARNDLAQQLREIGRTIERTLLDLAPEAEVTTSVRQAMEDAARDDAEAHRGDEGAVAVAEEAEPVGAEGPPDEERRDDEDLDAREPMPTAAATAVPIELPPGAPEPIELRTSALTTLHPKLVRKLKRGLQDLQNGTLDRLRRADGQGDVEQFVPDEAAIGTLAALADEYLRAAHRAGVLGGEELTGREVEVPPTARPLGERLVVELGNLLIAALGETLAEGLEAQEDVAALGDRVDTVYTDVKSGLVDEESVVALISAYELGLHDAWAAAGVPARVYVVSREPQCVDERCAQNAAAGPVPTDQPFPSGDEAPPVGPGCHCTTVPVLEIAS